MWKIICSINGSILIKLWLSLLLAFMKFDQTGRLYQRDKLTVCALTRVRPHSNIQMISSLPLDVSFTLSQDNISQTRHHMFSESSVYGWHINKLAKLGRRDSSSSRGGLMRAEGGHGRIKSAEEGKADLCHSGWISEISVTESSSAHATCATQYNTCNSTPITQLTQHVRVYQRFTDVLVT